MIEKLFAGLALCFVVAACTTPQNRPGIVYERIGAEVEQAAGDRRAAEAVEKALLPPLTVEMPKLSDAEPRFDLSVVGASAAQVFMAIVTGTRYNMLVPPEVTGQITVSLKDVTVREALEAIREIYGYEFAIKGNRIVIEPNTLRTRIFQINYLASRRQGSSDLRVTSSSIVNSTPTTGTPTGANPNPAQTPGQPGATNQALSSRVHTETDSDFWGGLTGALTAIVGSAEGRKVVINPQSGLIVVSAMPREIRQVENYLKATQVVVDRQVMLEAKILDVVLNREYQAGINWTAFRTGHSTHGGIGIIQPGTSLNTAGQGSTEQTLPRVLTDSNVSVLPGRYGSAIATQLGKGFIGLALQTKNFAALLNFLETQGTVTVLSSPRIATINNQKAVLKVGTDEMFVTNVTTTSTTTSGTTSNMPTVTLQPYFSGISLDVTPQIDQDSNIVLHIHPAVSVVEEREKVIDLGSTLGQYKLPLAFSNINETDSIVRVADGNIVAIGGLMTQAQTRDRSQLPGTGEIPVVGALFGQRSNALKKRELVILLKPTVIQHDQSWVRDLEQTGERLRAVDPREFIRGDD